MMFVAYLYPTTVILNQFIPILSSCICTIFCFKAQSASIDNIQLTDKCTLLILNNPDRTDNYENTKSDY